MPRNEVSFPAATRIDWLAGGARVLGVDQCTAADISVSVVGEHAHRAAQVDGDASGYAAVNADSLDCV